MLEKIKDFDTPKMPNMTFGILAFKAKISESGLFPSVSGIAFFREKAIFSATL